MNLEIFSKIIDIQDLKEIHNTIEKSRLINSQIRIMPNFSVEPTCISGLTAVIDKEFDVDIIGSDLGCGILIVELGDIEIDIQKLDETVKKNIPCGRNIHSEKIKDFDFSHNGLNINRPWRFERCLGTLGGGMHFIELSMDEDNNKYLLIHSGSRGYGIKVAFGFKHNDYVSEKLRRDEFFSDLGVCLRFAAENRSSIADIILEKLDLKDINRTDIPHNYIQSQKIIRKGAISARKDEVGIIAADNCCLLGRGKGNTDWNMSAPSSIGRTEADIDDFVKAIEPTFKVEKLLKPLYNFKPL